MCSCPDTDIDPCYSKCQGYKLITAKQYKNDTGQSFLCHLLQTTISHTVYLY